MASIIIFSTLWGIALKEWKGAGKPAMRLLFLALALLVGSTMIVGYGNYLARWRTRNVNLIDLRRSCRHRNPPATFRFLLRDSLRVAIRALHEMNVVQALRRLERRIHGFHVQTAIRKLRMARGARCPCLLPVPLVACKTTEPFVDADCGPIVARAHFPVGQRRVALIAESLANVRTDPDVARTIAHRR